MNYSGFVRQGATYVEAIKDTKHMNKNLSRYILSENGYIRAEYNKFRIQLGSLMRELDNIRNDNEGFFEYPFSG